MGSRLVRDNALANWRVPGAETQVRKAHNKEEHLILLRRKLIEEASELAFADNETILDESADLFNVIFSYCVLHGFDLPDLLDKFFEQRDKYGDFTDGMVWEN